jgi:FixJ family two-component response regulator
MAQRPTVFIVDDDDDVRRSLCWLLRSSGYAVRDFVSAEEFLAGSRDCDTPACLLLDVYLPGMDGLALLREVRSLIPLLPVLMFTAYGDVPTAVAALKLGAVDFIEKPYDDRTMLETIAMACRKQQSRLEQEQRRAAVEALYGRLTPREREVYDLLVQGIRSREIAETLGITERTLECHRQRVIHKMEVNSIAELVRLSIFVAHVDEV